MDENKDFKFTELTLANQLPITFKVADEDELEEVFDHYVAWCLDCNHKVTDKDIRGNLKQVSSTTYRFEGVGTCSKCGLEMNINLRFSSDGTSQVTINGQEFAEKVYYSKEGLKQALRIVAMVASAILIALFISYNMTH